mmetsp:Transcript_22561/g.62613  ORF Transcript_22561/g.62613 Transcript_22561/m.62613 type:complete len:2063 (+) Transcript_22561:179-6367(+)|eukprot:CAMPEP_0117666144 /NCGR_PEP_ID=MMETSP0804-20121206/10208_1 /TAXON_ID=1074897 /ORGANISM="Tetraselmis astigmatica, Strain CCMP880" /LENGTH=2062 /DNA_ID=CAMNT_0005473647 /DNA_START=160 /DNA_END=6348 /DNA_ORIENTATION=+
MAEKRPAGEEQWSQPGVLGRIGGLFWGSRSAGKPPPAKKKVTVAKLPEGNQFYYDEETKTWRERGKEAEATDRSKPSSPPKSFSGSRPPSVDALNMLAQSPGQADSSSPRRSASSSMLPSPSTNMYSSRGSAKDIRNRYVDVAGKKSDMSKKSSFGSMSELLTPGAPAGAPLSPGNQPVAMFVPKPAMGSSQSGPAMFMPLDSTCQSSQAPVGFEAKDTDTSTTSGTWGNGHTDSATSAAPAMPAVMFFPKGGSINSPENKHSPFVAPVSPTESPQPPEGILEGQQQPQGALERAIPAPPEDSGRDEPLAPMQPQVPHNPMPGMFVPVLPEDAAKAEPRGTGLKPMHPSGEQATAEERLQPVATPAMYVPGLPQRGDSADPSTHTWDGVQQRAPTLFIPAPAEEAGGEAATIQDPRGELPPSAEGGPEAAAIGQEPGDTPLSPSQELSSWFKVQPSGHSRSASEFFAQLPSPQTASRPSSPGEHTPVEDYQAPGPSNLQGDSSVTLNTNGTGEDGASAAAGSYDYSSYDYYSTEQAAAEGAYDGQQQWAEGQMQAAEGHGYVPYMDADGNWQYYYGDVNSEEYKYYYQLYCDYYAQYQGAEGWQGGEYGAAGWQQQGDGGEQQQQYDNCGADSPVEEQADGSAAYGYVGAGGEEAAGGVAPMGPSEEAAAGRDTPGSLHYHHHHEDSASALTALPDAAAAEAEGGFTHPDGGSLPNSGALDPSEAGNGEEAAALPPQPFASPAAMAEGVIGALSGALDRLVGDVAPQEGRTEAETNGVLEVPAAAASNGLSGGQLPSLGSWSKDDSVSGGLVAGNLPSLGSWAKDGSAAEPSESVDSSTALLDTSALTAEAADVGEVASAKPARKPQRKARAKKTKGKLAKSLPWEAADAEAVQTEVSGALAAFEALPEVATDEDLVPLPATATSTALRVDVHGLQQLSPGEISPLSDGWQDDLLPAGTLLSPSPQLCVEDLPRQGPQEAAAAGFESTVTLSNALIEETAAPEWPGAGGSGWEVEEEPMEATQPTAAPVHEPPSCTERSAEYAEEEQGRKVAVDQLVVEPAEEQRAAANQPAGKQVSMPQLLEDPQLLDGVAVPRLPEEPSAEAAVLRAPEPPASDKVAVPRLLRGAVEAAAAFHLTREPSEEATAPLNEPAEEGVAAAPVHEVVSGLDAEEMPADKTPADQVAAARLPEGNGNGGEGNGFTADGWQELVDHDALLDTIGELRPDIHSSFGGSSPAATTTGVLSQSKVRNAYVDRAEMRKLRESVDSVTAHDLSYTQLILSDPGKPFLTTGKPQSKVADVDVHMTSDLPPSAPPRRKAKKIDGAVDNTILGEAVKGVTRWIQSTEDAEAKSIEVMHCRIVALEQENVMLRVGRKSDAERCQELQAQVADAHAKLTESTAEIWQHLKRPSQVELGVASDGAVEVALSVLSPVKQLIQENAELREELDRRLEEVTRLLELEGGQTALLQEQLDKRSNEVEMLLELEQANQLLRQQLEDREEQLLASQAAVSSLSAEREQGSRAEAAARGRLEADLAQLSEDLSAAREGAKEEQARMAGELEQLSSQLVTAAAELSSSHGLAERTAQHAVEASRAVAAAAEEQLSALLVEARGEADAAREALEAARDEATSQGVAVEEIEAMTRELKAALDAASAAEEEIARLLEEQEEADRTEAKLQLKAEELEEELRARTLEREEQSRAAAAAEERIQAAQSAVHSYQQDLEAAVAEKISAAEQCALLSEDLSAAQGGLAEARAGLEAAAAREAQLAYAKAAALEESVAARQEADAVAQQLAAQTQEWTDAMVAAKKEIEEVKSKLRAAVKKGKAIEKDKQALASQLEEAKVHLAQAEERAAAAEADAAAAKEASFDTESAARSELEESRAEAAALKESLHEALQAEGEASARAGALETAFAAVSLAAVAAMASAEEAHTLADRREALDSQLVEAADDAMALAGHVLAAAEEAGQATSTEETLQLEIDGLKALLLASESKCEQLQQDNEELQCTVDTQQQEFNDLLACLGQETAKVVALQEVLEEHGVDADAILAKVEEEYGFGDEEDAEMED